jgi:hypothetical protein
MHGGGRAGSPQRIQRTVEVVARTRVNYRINGSHLSVLITCCLGSPFSVASSSFILAGRSERLIGNSQTIMVQRHRQRQRRDGGSSSKSTRRLLRRLLVLYPLLSLQLLLLLLLLPVQTSDAAPLSPKFAVVIWKASQPFVGKLTKSAVLRTRQAWSLKHPTTLLSSLQGLRTCQWWRDQSNSNSNSSTAIASSTTGNNVSTIIANCSTDYDNHTSMSSAGSPTPEEIQQRRRRRLPSTNGAEMN